MKKQFTLRVSVSRNNSFGNSFLWLEDNYSVRYIIPEAEVSEFIEKEGFRYKQMIDYYVEFERVRVSEKTVTRLTELFTKEGGQHD